MNWNKCRDFLSGMENPLIIYHKDSDGVCSAALLNEYVGGSAHPNNGPGIDLGETIEQMIMDSEEVIFLDLPVDHLDISQKLRSGKFFVLDHHPPKKNLTDGNVLHVNPRFEDEEIYQPASYLSHRIAERKLENVAWKAGVGIIGDHGIEDCKDLIDEIGKELPETVPENKYNFDELKESKLGAVSEMIEASKVIDGISGIKQSFEVIRNAKVPNDVFDSGLLDFYNEYRNELEREVERFQKEADYFPKTNAYLYEVKSNSSIAPNLANLVSNRNKDSIVIVCQAVSKGLNLSARCDSGRKDVSEILKEAVEGKGRAGGHPQAAGGFVSKGKENVVLERLKERLERVS